MPIDMKKLGHNLKVLREHAHLTQAHLADYLSVDQSLISKVENGERTISTDLLDNLAVLFCCPLDALLTGEEVSPKFSSAFRGGAMSGEDLTVLAALNRIALNQGKMDQLAGGIAHDR